IPIVAIASPQATTRLASDIRTRWRAARGRTPLWPLLALCLFAGQIPAQQPSSEGLLSSYEGQTVSTVELAARPDIAAASLEQLQSLVTQKPGEPFEVARINESIQALKDTRQFEDVTLEVLPELNGLRVTLVLEPAYYIGEYTFPGAYTRFFSYSRLLHVSNYTSQQPYSTLNIHTAESPLTHH